MYALRNMRFFLVSFILFCSIVLTINLSAFTIENIFLGTLSAGGILAGCLFLEKWFKQVNLLSFNALVLGLFIGFFLGKSLCLIFERVVPTGFNQMVYY